MTERWKKRLSTYKELLKASLPAAIDMSSQPLVWLYEAFLLGRLSFSALGSVGLALQLILITMTVVITFIIGSSLIINRHLGKKDSWQANHILGQSVMLGLGLSVVIGFMWFFSAPLLFKVIKETEPNIVSAQDYGIRYLQTLAFFAPVIIPSFLALGIIRATGDSRYALIINGVIIGINIFLAPLLMFGELGFPRLEVFGLALAKGIAYTVGFILTLIVLRSRKCCLFLSFRETATPNWNSVKELFRKGIPTTVEQLSWSVGQFIVSGYAARLGIVVLTTHQILLLLQMVMSMCYQGFGISSMALVGKNVGAEDRRSAERTGLAASGIVLFFVLLIVWGMYAFRVEILQIFTKSPDVFALGLSVILIFSFVQIPKALNAVIIGNLRGAGELYWVMWITIASVIIFEISASWVIVFVYQFALAGIWVVHGFDEASRLICNFIRFRTGKWRFRSINI